MNWAWPSLGIGIANADSDMYYKLALLVYRVVQKKPHKL